MFEQFEGSFWTPYAYAEKIQNKKDINNDDDFYVIAECFRELYYHNYQERFAVILDKLTAADILKRCKETTALLGKITERYKLDLSHPSSDR